MTEPVALHRLILDLPPRKRALLAARNPLSFAQERLWFVDQLVPGNPVYNIPFALRLDGDLDSQVLRLAIREVLRRHDALRTTFAAPDGRPMQVVHPPGGDILPLIDLTHLPKDAREESVRRLVLQETGKPFDLAHGPLLRTSLLRLGVREHVLCGAMHHIVSDGWSLEVLIREVSTLYSAFLAGEPSPLLELPIQYLDFARWQREQLRGLMLREHLDYWKRTLDGAPPVHELPTDRPRPKIRSHHGASCSLSISPEIADGLRRVGRQANATLFATLLGAFLTLQGRLSERDDVVVGSPVAGRTREELEPLIGFFVNMLVLRGDLAGNPRFSELLARVREVVVGAQAHQDLPFEKLVEELQPERNLSYSPLFQIAFVLLVPAREELDLPGLRLRRMGEETTTSMFDLRLLCLEADGGVATRLEYSTDLFCAATIDRFLRQLRTLVTAIAKAPEQRLRDLPLLDEAERREILALVEEGWREVSAAGCLHEIFAEQAALRPAATAVTFEGETLSYGELDRWANRLAWRLRALGVGPDVRVALCLERSLDLVVGVLAVLKAGGVYVPLDPAYPAERLAFLLEDSQARVLLTRGDLTVPLPAEGQEQVLLDQDDLAEWSDESPASGTQPENAAYVIYTSGSTGRPKGVVVTHANVVRLFAATQDDFRFDSGDAWTLFHSYAFDFSVWEIWGALLYGGRLVVVPYWTSRSPEAFHALLCREKVTVLNQTPSAFFQLDRAEESGAATGELSLQWIVFGGEALDFQSLAPWFARHGDARPRLVNMYGITETTVHVTFRPLSAVDSVQPASVIGPPLADLRLYVLDRGRELSPLGVPGEIFVAGAGLARGYLRRPELTAERFVPDPFGAPGGRLYKTGDLARRLAGGEIEYLGRTDDQVKIRGFRIEIGEIQAALTAHPGVTAGAVLALKGGSEGARLVAWWVPNGGPVPSGGELREFLRTRLPEHMVPTAFVRLDRLPLTTNGKLDRAALPVPSETLVEDVRHVAPRTPLEEVLAAVWAQVLRAERVGAHDNFFALGGDSIRSVQVVALARERGIELSVQDLFEYQTVADLAAGLGDFGSAAALPDDRAPFSLITDADRAGLPADVEDAYPLTRLQAGMLYHMALDPEAPLYHNVVSWHLAGPFDAAALQSAVDRAVARHGVLRTSFDLASPGGPIQRVHRDVPLPVEVEDLTALSVEEQERAIDAYLQLERGRPFELTCPPMLRMRVHRRSEGTFQLTLTENHAIFDGWSLHSTLAEIFRTYFARLDGAELAPEPPPVFSFADFVALERAALEAEEPRAYWLRRMAEAPFSALPRWPAMGSPVLGNREVGPGVGGVTLALPPALQSGIRALARTAVVPLKSVLLAAHARVVGLACGQMDIVTGLVGHGRPESQDGTEVRGLFLNTLPLRLDLSRGSWQELVRAVFAAEWEMLPHRRYPLAALQEDLGGRQLFETGFNYIHFHVVDDVVRSGGITVLGMKRSEGNNFTLMANFSQNPVTGEVALGLEYGARALTSAQAEAIAGYYLHAFEAMVRDPLAQHAAADLLSEPERQQLLVEWNDEAAPIPQDATLPLLFAAQVERQPGAAAVVCGGEELTYRGLLERSRALADHLRQLGVGPETLVGLHAERTPEMLIGLLGILEAGGAYLPLDPALPQERLAWMLEDSRAPVVLTQQRLRGELPAWGGIALCLDGEELAGTAPCTVPAATDPDRLAYVLYTSGSTGRPKGVPITHRNVVNFLGFMGPRLGITERDTLLAVTTLSFDISVLELILPLVRGARIALVGPDVSTDGERLAEAIALYGATVMQATPATWQLLLQSGWQGRADFRILCGGEALPGDLARQLLERGSEVWNLYGPTETTIWSALHRVVPEPGVAPLGRPIDNTALHVLDNAFRPQPPGVPGELFIGGAGLSRGYLNRSELTAEKFVPDPFAGQPGARLYRTGDLVRRRPDGILEFLGRTDHQVKLRGFRIELGEIEAALREHPAIREAAVVLREDRAGDRRLVGYVVAGPPVPSDLSGQLRVRLQQSLPAYMSLAAVVVLDAMPRTPNGKLNRRALPAPADRAFGTDEAYVAPRTPLEEGVARVWAELLGLERVGAESSFFELGGHSLLATRLVHRLASDFQVELRLPQLFATPTVAGLAAAIARCKAEGATAGGGLFSSRLPAIVPDRANRSEPFPLNDVQQAYWVGRGADFALGNVSSHNYTEMEIPHLDVAQLESALRRLIDRHDMLRAVVLSDGRQQILPEVPPYEVQVQDLRGADPAQAASALEQVRAVMSHQVLPADRWPLFEVRASLFDGGRARLHFSLDYLVADAWSMRIIFREIFRFYKEPELVLPPLDLSFRDCVLAEKALDATDVYERAERYWQERLPSLPPAPELPLACDPRELGTPHFVRRLARLPAERWSRVKSAAARAGLTPSGVLLAAFAEVLGVWSKSPRFTINVTLFNRPPLHPQIDDVVGDFTTLSLLAVDVSRGNTFALRARGVQEQLWSDMEHRAVSAVRVLRDLARTQGRTPDSIMPVVFTSALGQGEATRPDAEASRASDGGEESSYGISQTPQVWLDHQVVETRGTLVYNWDAVDELFPPGCLDEMFAAFRGLLEELAAREEWDEISRPLPPAAHLEVQRAANDTAGPVPEELLHACFALQAAAQPERPAVIAPSCTLSYGELDRRSNQLARRLRELGVQPNQLVAVVMEKGWEQVVAVLAVLKSGAAYLPIDSGLPEKRLQHLLELGEVRVALTQPSAAIALTWPAGLERIVVEEEPSAELSDAPLEPVQRQGDLAYVIYTSGSTGLPKGVMIDHRGAINTVLDVNERFAVGQDDRVLALSALNFDLSVWDIFGLLAAGGAIVFPNPADLRDPAAWADLIQRHGVTIWNTVPALLEMLVEGAPAEARLDSLRLALLSGDWIPVTLPDRFRARAEGAQVISMGGATEASIWSILYAIEEVDPSWTSIPYGRGMRNQTFHVLDHALDPRPLGVPGELYIGGIGVALGYWRDEEKTAARFIRHPRTGERLYRTGDLGRFLPDGNIEFLGREDFQIKIRGHRIELGEIEAALHQIGDVRSAVVNAVGEDRSSRRLVAYVVLDRPAPEPQPALLAAPAAAPAARPMAVARPAVRMAADGDLPLFEPIKNEIAKLEFRLAEHGLRRDEGRSAVPLASPALDEAFLAPYRERRTHREFLQEPVPLDRLHRVLSALMETGTEGSAKRRYLSPGGAYPVEIHVQVRPRGVESLEAGTYHYDPASNRLTLTTPGADIEPRWYEGVNQPVARQSAFGIFLIGRPDALRAAYGETAREWSLLEAGSLGQLLMEVGPAEGLGFCPIGGIAFHEARGLFGVDPSCVLLHSFLGGMIAGGDPKSRATRELPRPAHVEGSFLEDRVSAGAFGRFLAALRQVRLPDFPVAKYRYASAGALYPVQAYVAVAPGRVEGVEAGVYYYHPRDHRLVRITEGAEALPTLCAVADAELPGGLAFSLVFTGRLGAIAPLYGDVARDFCLLEAGYMGQLLAVAGREMGIGIVPAACPDFWNLRDSFALDRDHVPLLAVVGGAIQVESGVATVDVSAAGPQRLDLPTEAERIRSRLAEVLPDYMVPSQIVFLTELPLTANGKVDRQGLPAPEEAEDGGSASAQASSVAPRSEMERSIAKVWCEVLGRERIGIHDNFFELGGTSLHMIRMRNRLQEELGRNVQITEFFKFPSVASLARELSRSHGEGEEAGGGSLALEEIDERMQKQKSALQRQKMAAQRRMKAHE